MQRKDQGSAYARFLLLCPNGGLLFQFGETAFLIFFPQRLVVRPVLFVGKGAAVGVGHATEGFDG